MPGGIVTAVFCEAEYSHDLTPLGPTLRDVLDSIVVADPQYKWDLEQGVVNFGPIKNEPMLLDVVIANFHFEGNKPVDDILQDF